MHPPAKRWRLVLPLLFLPCLLFSQEIAPYSRFGLGELSSSSFAASKGMGRLAAGYRAPLHINFLNPASYSAFSTALKLTTLEAGFNFTTKKITDGLTNKSYRTGDGFLDYVALGFPAGKSGGASIGLIPYSQMSYSFKDTLHDDTLGDIAQQYDGSGRLYQLYGGGAVRFAKNDTLPGDFSIGLNFSYVFGNLDRTEVLQFPDGSFYNTRISSSARVGSYVLSAGVQYKRTFSDSLYAVIGAYGLFPVASTSTEYVKWDRFVILSSGVFVVDTVYDDDRKNENIKIPPETGVGISVGQPEKWMAGVDFKYSVWNDVETFSNEAVFENSWELRGGGEFKPDFRSQKLFKSSSYRLGAYYNRGYLNTDGERISEYGFTFGIGLPVKSWLSRLNFSFDAGNRGTLKNGLISETFFRAYIGLTLNEKWFTKPKYD